MTSKNYPRTLRCMAAPETSIFKRIAQWVRLRKKEKHSIMNAIERLTAAVNVNSALVSANSATLAKVLAALNAANAVSPQVDALAASLETQNAQLSSDNIAANAAVPDPAPAA